MNQEFMKKVQRSSDSVWSLQAGTSTTLEVGPGPRVLQVSDGRLWLTSPGNADEDSMDVWLVPGESLELPSGLKVVLEAWPSAHFQLLVPPSACRRRGAREPSILASAGAWVAHRLRGLGVAALQTAGHR